MEDEEQKNVFVFQNEASCSVRFLKFFIPPSSLVPTLQNDLNIREHLSSSNLCNAS